MGERIGDHHDRGRAGPKWDSSLFPAFMVGLVIVSIVLLGVYVVFPVTPHHITATLHPSRVMCALGSAAIGLLALLAWMDPGVIAPRAEVDEVVACAMEGREHPLAHTVTESLGLYRRTNSNGEEERYCATCNVWRPPLATHCSFCGYCMLRFDHHCDVIGTCVAAYNHRFFVLFLLCCGAGCALVAGCAVLSFYSLTHEHEHDHDHDSHNAVLAYGGTKNRTLATIAVMMAFLFTAWTGVAVGCFGCGHFFMLCCETTTKENVRSGGNAIVEQWRAWAVSRWLRGMRDCLTAPVRSKWAAGQAAPPPLPRHDDDEEAPGEPTGKDELRALL